MLRLPNSTVSRVTAAVGDNVAIGANKPNFGRSLGLGFLNEMYVDKFPKPGESHFGVLVGPLGTAHRADTLAIKRHWKGLSGPEKVGAVAARSPIVVARTAFTAGAVGAYAVAAAPYAAAYGVIRVVGAVLSPAAHLYLWAFPPLGPNVFERMRSRLPQSNR
jgi:hypothetical protein